MTGAGTLDLRPDRGEARVEVRAATSRSAGKIGARAGPAGREEHEGTARRGALDRRGQRFGGARLLATVSRSQAHPAFARGAFFSFAVALAALPSLGLCGLLCEEQEQQEQREQRPHPASHRRHHRELVCSVDRLSPGCWLLSSVQAADQPARRWRSHSTRVFRAGTSTCAAARRARAAAGGGHPRGAALSRSCCTCRCLLIGARSSARRAVELRCSLCAGVTEAAVSGVVIY